MLQVATEARRLRLGRFLRGVPTRCVECHQHPFGCRQLRSALAREMPCLLNRSDRSACLRLRLGLG